MRGAVALVAGLAAACAPFAAQASTYPEMPRCTLPSLPGDARLVLFGAYGGNAVSSVSVGGPDQATDVIDVEIERGTRRLYLVLTSYESMVWRIRGDTGRIAAVVVSAFLYPRKAGDKSSPPPVPMSAAGVTGVPREKVTIAPTNCPAFFHAPDGKEARTAAATLHRALGFRPDAVFGGYHVRRVALPSGTMSPVEKAIPPMPAGFDLALWREALRYHPGGLVRIGRGRVVARAPVAPYPVLPSEMGLAQLLGAGAIERRPDGAFRVLRPIAHLPPRLRAKFFLAPGVPMPPGNPWHGCIVEEATGRTRGSICAMMGERTPEQ